MRKKLVDPKHQMELKNALSGLARERSRVQKELAGVDDVIKATIATALRHRLTWGEVGGAMAEKTTTVYARYGKRKRVRHG